MVVRVVSLRIPPDKSEAAATVWKNSILPSLVKVRGLFSVEVLRSPGKNGQDEWLILTRWSSREDLDRYVASGKSQEYLAELTDLLSEAPGPAKTYELVT